MNYEFQQGFGAGQESAFLTLYPAKNSAPGGLGKFPLTIPA
jgi:hypothetical protein